MNLFVIRFDGTHVHSKAYVSLRAACVAHGLSYQAAIRKKQRTFFQGNRMVSIDEVQVEKIRGRGSRGGFGKGEG